MGIGNQQNNKWSQMDQPMDQPILPTLSIQITYLLFFFKYETIGTCRFLNKFID